MKRILSFVLVFLFSLSFLLSQSVQKSKQVKIFPDEYSELDDVPISKNINEPFVFKTLERARVKYLKALSLIEEKDTLQAAHFFEEAIDILNSLINVPNISQYPDYSDLARSILEDYEKYIQNIGHLDESSSLFLMRETLNKELEISPNRVAPKIGRIESQSAKADTTQPAVSGMYQIPMDENEYVRKSIEFLTQKPIGRKFVKGSLERSTAWGSMVKQIIKEEGMPEEIYYLAMVESAFNPFAVSRAKAVGMWQFITSTGLLYGLNKNSSAWVDERRDPLKATRAAMRHLKDLYNEFGDWHLAIAAYNCGLLAVQKAIARFGSIDSANFWNIMQFLPRETRNYVPLFIATVKVVSNLEAYGFNPNDFNYDREITFDKYVIKEPVNLSAIAKCANTTVDEIKKLNPELISNFTPPDLPEYEIRIPAGSRATFVSNYLNLTPEEKAPFFTVKISGRETLNSLAQKYKVDVNDVVFANPSINPNKILKKGTVVRIPLGAKTTASESLASDEPSSSVNSSNGEQQQDNYNNPKLEYQVHIIKKNETLNSIARKYNIDEEAIRGANPDINFGSLKEGNALRIPLQSANIIKNVTSSNSQIVINHIVKENETLFDVAKKYNVSLDSLLVWNNLRNYKIYPGKSIKIKLENQNFTQQSNVQSNSDNLDSGTFETFSPTVKKEYVIKEVKIQHKVKKGETLASIADKYNVTIQQIVAWNPKLKKRMNNLLAGEVLKLYTKRKVEVDVSSNKTGNNTKGKSKYHIVRPGDTLSSISSRYGVPIEVLVSKNPNLNPNHIRVGQKIVID